MKLGIRNLKYALTSQVSDFSMMPPGSSINLAAFMTGNLSDLPFTPESADFTEKWSYDENGKYSDVSITIPIRADKDAYRNILQGLTGKKAIFQLELISGVKYVIGSKEFVPTFTFTDGISGISSSGFTIKIDCKSLHGVFLAL
jgi:hypothetical protein